MSRNSDWFRLNGITGPALWLRVAVAALALLNVVAIYLFVFPPGGSRRELEEQETSMRRAIALHRGATERLKTVSAKVELGGAQTDRFAQTYFLPHRTAFGSLVSELLRMSTTAGLREGQRTYSQEPIEGTDDLTLVSINANYQGSYAELMKFVNEVDHSDQLLILDTLAATPLQQGAGGSLNVIMRFLAVVKDDGATAAGAVGGQP